MADLMAMNPPPQGQQLPQSVPDRKPPSKDRLKEIVGRKEAEVTSRIGKRTSLEDRWIADLEQYHGRYDPGTAKALFDEERSGLFINVTRPKADALAARLKDFLFPTDEKNWGIGPTPVPRLAEYAEQAAADLRQKQESYGRPTAGGSGGGTAPGRGATASAAAGTVAACSVRRSHCSKRPTRPRRRPANSTPGSKRAASART